jgi:DHA1 family inner membrane transport protein
MLRDIAGLSSGWISAALVIYGLGTITGNTLAGRVPPQAIARILPAPLAALAAVLLIQGVLMHHAATGIASLFLMGVSAFIVAPLVQTWLMNQAGPAIAGLAAAVNISVFGLAAALGAAAGGAVISAGLGLDRVSPLAAIPVLAAVAVALTIRPRPRCWSAAASGSATSGRAGRCAGR